VVALAVVALAVVALAVVALAVVALAAVVCLAGVVRSEGMADSISEVWWRLAACKSF
jgi:hypothetical protein